MTPTDTAITSSKPMAPDAIPGYRLETLIGKGGMGEVYKGVQLSLERPVAVKLLPQEYASDESFVARFEKEAAALAQLSHPNIVSIVDKGTIASTSYLVMEFVGGPSLRDLIRDKSLDWMQSLLLVLDICRAIDYAHSRGVVHRDLKPENILFDTQAGSIPKVTDFGLAGFVRHDAESRFRLTQTHVSMGTVQYMAPEQQVDAKAVDGRADLYSLGVILYELIAGDVPRGNFDPPSVVKPGVDKRVDAIVARCLKAAPADRYASGAELIADLEPLVPNISRINMQKMKLSRTQRARIALERAMRVGARWVAIAMVAEALLIIAVAGIRARQTKPDRWDMQVKAAAANLAPRQLLNIPSRLEVSSSRRFLLMGEGTENVPFVGWGRAISQDKDAVVFGADREQAGRAFPEVADLAGNASTVSAELAPVRPLRSRIVNSLRRLIFGTIPEPRVALMLQGAANHYVAVVFLDDGAPSLLEWNLGERRGMMFGPVPSADKNTRVEISIDREGELRASLGPDDSAKAIGEPLRLGREWKSLFGATLKPAVACVSGICRFRKLAYEVRRVVDPPPPPPPPPVITAAAIEPPSPPAKKPVVHRPDPPRKEAKKPESRRRHWFP